MDWKEESQPFDGVSFRLHSLAKFSSNDVSSFENGSGGLWGPSPPRHDMSGGQMPRWQHANQRTTLDREATELYDSVLILILGYLAAANGVGVVLLVVRGPPTATANRNLL